MHAELACLPAHCTRGMGCEDTVLVAGSHSDMRYVDKMSLAVQASCIWSSSLPRQATRTMYVGKNKLRTPEEAGSGAA